MLGEAVTCQPPSSLCWPVRQDTLWLPVALPARPCSPIHGPLTAYHRPIHSLLLLRRSPLYTLCLKISEDTPLLPRAKPPRGFHPFMTSLPQPTTGPSTVRRRRWVSSPPGPRAQHACARAEEKKMKKKSNLESSAPWPLWPSRTERFISGFGDFEKLLSVKADDVVETHGAQSVVLQYLEVNVVKGD